MNAQLYSAILNPESRNYAWWRELLGSNCVPLKTPLPRKAALGPESDVEVYLLDIRALTLRQRARLLHRIAQKFGVPIYEVEYQLDSEGFPIRASDVIVNFHKRAFG